MLSVCVPLTRFWVMYGDTGTILFLPLLFLLPESEMKDMSSEKSPQVS